MPPFLRIQARSKGLTPNSLQQLREQEIAPNLNTCTHVMLIGFISVIFYHEIVPK